jgi:hypothetical protein
VLPWPSRLVLPGWPKVPMTSVMSRTTPMSAARMAAGRHATFGGGRGEMETRGVEGRAQQAKCLVGRAAQKRERRRRKVCTSEGRSAGGFGRLLLLLALRRLLADAEVPKTAPRIPPLASSSAASQASSYLYF